MKQILVFIHMIISVTCFAQSPEKKTQIYTADGVEINLIKSDCIDKQYDIQKQILYFEIINSNSYSVNISFKKELWYDNVCSACSSDSPEYEVNQTIEASSTIQGGCTSKNTLLNIFVKMLKLSNVRQLTNYEFKAIKIEKAS